MNDTHMDSMKTMELEEERKKKANPAPSNQIQFNKLQDDAKKHSTTRHSCENCFSPEKNDALKACSRCKLVFYCSKECQATHWKINHKKTCISINERKVSNQVPQMESTQNEHSHKLICAICLDSVDNTSCTLPCEHAFHGHCLKSLRSHEGLSKVCPLCRSDLPPGPQEAYMRACSLLEKLGYIYDGKTKAERIMIDKMIKLMKCSAEEGFATAQHSLGTIYYNGHGVEKDTTKARKWYLKAACQDYAESQHNLGVMHDCGHGVKQDYTKAQGWYLKAADQGHIASQHNLGNMYNGGCGVKQDYVKARGWYLKAANQGHATSQHNLGGMYNKGNGVEQDSTEAHKWFLKAANQGKATSQHNLGVMYYNGDGVKQDYVKARNWFLKAAPQGYTSSQHILGIMYNKGQGMKQDDSKARYWYLKAASQGFVHSQRNLKVMECGKE